jgi:hypothetical protein
MTIPDVNPSIWLNLISTPSAENKLLIVRLGGLEPLIRQMLSPNVEVQCNAVGCITNLATHGQYFTSSRLSFFFKITFLTLISVPF